jgi:hypothetical protein
VTASVVASYLLKYMKTATASRTIVRIQRDESLIPVFLAMRQSYLRFIVVGKSETHLRATPGINPVIPWIDRQS